MFNGSTPAPPPARPERPHILNTRAMLPMLRAQATEAAVEYLAHAAAYNALQAGRWAALRWGPEVGPFGPAHLRRGEAQDPSTPVGKVVEAQGLLSTTCSRHRAATGEDGLALARSIILRAYGAATAEFVLAPLVAMKTAWPRDELSAQVDALLDASEADATPAKEPAPDERNAALQELLALVFSGTGMDRVWAALEVLGAAADGPEDDGASAALEALSAALQSAADLGVGEEEIRAALDYWADATGGPRVVLNLGGR